MIKLILQIVFVIALVVIGMAFLFQNDAKVSIDFFFAKTELFTVGVLVILSFVGGMVLGLIARLPSSLAQRFSNKRLKNQVTKQDREIKKLSSEVHAEA